MKKDTNKRVKLGIFVAIGIAIFLVGIYFIGEKQQLFRSTFRVSGIFRDVDGLQAGNNVRFSGMNVGTVDYVSIVSDSTVKVEILIDEDIRKYIKKDAIASIGSEGLMGNKVLIINPGSGARPEIENNDTVETTQPVSIDNIMISLKSTIDNTTKITSDLSKIASSIESGKGTIGKLLMDPKLAMTFDSSFVNLKLGSEGLRILMDDSRVTFAQNFDSTFINLREGSAGFKVLMDKAKKSWLLWGF
jgi:phospholipid/cholesterol/gamma-HCH transport system substrate-binding protein